MSFASASRRFLISTHLVSEVEELIEEVVFLRHGEIAVSGNIEELRQNRGMSLSDIFEEVVS